MNQFQNALSTILATVIPKADRIQKCLEYGKIGLQQLQNGIPDDRNVRLDIDYLNYCISKYLDKPKCCEDMNEQDLNQLTYALIHLKD